MSNAITQTTPVRRLHLLPSYRGAAFAMIALLSLTATASPNTHARRFGGFQTFGNFRGPARHPGRTWYTPDSSMIAPPMEQTPRVAPLSPRIE
jgi:hypothetical protein